MNLKALLIFPGIGIFKRVFRRNGSVGQTFEAPRRFEDSRDPSPKLLRPPELLASKKTFLKISRETALILLLVRQNHLAWKIKFEGLDRQLGNRDPQI